MSKCTCAFPCGGTEPTCPCSPSYGAISMPHTGLVGFTQYMLENPMATYHSTWEAAQQAQAAEIQQLKLQLEPRTVRDVVSFAYIETMSSRQIHELLTKIHERNQELQAVVNMTAEAFDGGPDHPWIPGFDAQKIYKAVMKNYAPPLPSGQSGDPSQ